MHHLNYVALAAITNLVRALESQASLIAKLNLLVILTFDGVYTNLMNESGDSYISAQAPITTSRSQ